MQHCHLSYLLTLTVLSVFTVAKVGSKFGDDGSRRLYPEYHALVGGMRQQQRAAAAAATAATGPISLLGGSYAALAGVELRRVHADGRCELESQGGAAPAGGAPPDALTGDALRTRHTVVVDAVAVLVGSAPDLSFLPRAVRDALAAAGPPNQESAEGVKATHPVFVGVDPFTMEVEAVPSLFALGPLRGDNFARFAIHDGWGVAQAIRTQAAQVEGSQQPVDGSTLCEPEATAAA